MRHPRYYSTMQELKFKFAKKAHFVLLRHGNGRWNSLIARKQRNKSEDCTSDPIRHIDSSVFWYFEQSSSSAVAVTVTPCKKADIICPNTTKVC